MLNIVKGQSNELIVTATEKVAIDNPTFLIAFKNQLGAIVKSFIVNDTSLFPDRYNSFTFVEGQTDEQTLDKGTHYYTIYAQQSTTNIDPEQADQIVEIGVVYVTDTNIEYVQNDPNVTYTQNVI